MLPIEQSAMTEALLRASTTHRKNAMPPEMAGGKLLVFAGSKGGSGVTTVACNVAIALAQSFEQRVLLIDLALPIGDAALCLGISAGYSTEHALKNIDRMDGSFLKNLLERHRSGVYVLSAPTTVPEVEVSKAAIDKLIAVARREFDQVIVDVGSRIDVAAKALFENASTVYLVSQTGISELRNSNRLISQFFSDEGRSLEIVINRFDSHFHETMNEGVVDKALGRPVRWKIPNDQNAARTLQAGDTGRAETRVSRISVEMASSITGLLVPEGNKRDFDRGDHGRSAWADSQRNEVPGAMVMPSANERTTPSITWPTPDPITYGDKLTFAQLNAEASVEGTFVYTPGPSYVLPIGTHTLWVTFSPADTQNFLPLQASTSIVVVKATPILAWPKPAGIIYGAQLADSQLNASSGVAGRFEYSPAPGEVLPPGLHTLSVAFTPADSANYTTAQATVTLSVAKAGSQIQWPALDPITYGTQLSATQLCATASEQGTLEYSPALGAVLAAGEHRLSAVFTPEDHLGYSISQATVSLTVKKATPAIVWLAPEPMVCGAALSARQLNATATMPGTFTYTPAEGEILAPGVHQLSVNFTPTDSLNYCTASAVASLTVFEKLPAFITWPTPEPISYGTALGIIQLNATATIPGTFVYTPSAGHVLAPGRYTLFASFTPSDSDRYAPGHAAVELEVKGPPDAALPPTAADEKPAVSPIAAIPPAPPELEPAQAPDEHGAMKLHSRETRRYKGAVYEKGEDGQWHLQKT
jgi:MinD-like ATPase involved in chromosome partitioning or flagellar assembly